MAKLVNRLIPRSLPALSTILTDLNWPCARSIADYLDVTPRTVYRWMLDDKAPRAALVALWSLTTWAQSAAECQAVNDATLQACIANAHAAESSRRLAQLEHLLQVGDFGSANAPLVLATGPAVRVGPAPSTVAADRPAAPAPAESARPSGRPTLAA